MGEIDCWSSLISYILWLPLSSLEQSGLCLEGGVISGPYGGVEDEKAKVGLRYSPLGMRCFTSIILIITM